MTKQHIHQYVLEHITGSLQARTESAQPLWVAFCIALLSSVVILLSNTGDSSTVGLAICTLFAGIPLGVMAQRNTLRIALSRESLRLKRFLIGKKGYVAPKDHVLHEHADLFAIAANMVCKEPFFTPQSNAAAWHTHSVLADIPGIAAYEGWYGNNTQSSIFLYGELNKLTALATDVWDLGHVRRLTPSDKERFIETSKGWKKQQLISVGLVYAPLLSKADPANLHAQDIQDNCVLLGAIGLEGTRGYEQTMPLSPAMAIQRSTAVQVVMTVSLALFALVSTLGNRFFGTAPPANMLLLLAVSVFIAPLILAIYSWDHAVKNEGTSQYLPLWNAGLIAGLSYAIYLLYLFWQNAMGASVGSLAHQTGSAIAILTYGLSLLAYISFSRLGKMRKIKITAGNPLFLLAWSSSLLIILIIAYGSGPLLLGGILMAFGAATAYAAIHQLRSYADRHHSRDYIVELLRSN